MRQRFEVLTFPYPAVIISRQQRRVQLMRIKQREDRKEKKKKRRPHHPPPHQHKAHPPEPAYRRKPNPVRRFDGDVLSPVSPAPRVEISPGLGRLFLLQGWDGMGWDRMGWGGMGGEGTERAGSRACSPSAPFSCRATSRVSESGRQGHPSTASSPAPMPWWTWTMTAAPPCPSPRAPAPPCGYKPTQ